MRAEAIFPDLEKSPHPRNASKFRSPRQEGQPRLSGFSQTRTRSPGAGKYTKSPGIHETISTFHTRTTSKATGTRPRRENYNFINITFLYFTSGFSRFFFNSFSIQHLLCESLLNQSLCLCPLDLAVPIGFIGFWHQMHLLYRLTTSILYQPTFFRAGLDTWNTDVLGTFKIPVTKFTTFEACTWFFFLFDG